MSEIKGYRELSDEDIRQVNEIKDKENRLAEFVNDFLIDMGPGRSEAHRQLALAKTHFEDAFMHLVRHITLPDSPWPLEQ